MGYQKLAPNQEQLIRDMRTRGKTPQECSDYMKETFGIKVPTWKISYVVGKQPQNSKEKMPKEKKARLTHKKRKEAEIVEQVVSIEQALQDIMKGQQQIKEGYAAIFMHMRLEVIREAGKVFNMAKAAGIEIKADDIEE